MLYGEKLKYARNKLGLSRMRFAVLIGLTEGTIANIENCKDESKKLGYDKMLEVILVAKLPKGWWFYNDAEMEQALLGGTEIFARGGTVSEEEHRKILAILDRLNRV